MTFCDASLKVCCVFKVPPRRGASALRSFPWLSGAAAHGRTAFECPFIHGWTSELLSDHFGLVLTTFTYLCACREAGFHFSHLYTLEWGLQKLLLKPGNDMDSSYLR